MDGKKDSISIYELPDRIVEKAGGRWADTLQRRATIDLVLRHPSPLVALSSTNSSCSLSFAGSSH